MKPVAIFDIDGTIFRSSLGIELFKKLIEDGIFDRRFMKKIRKSEEEWRARTGHYDNYMWDVVNAYKQAIVGKSKAEIVRAAEGVIRQQRHYMYRYTRDLLNRIRKKYFMIAISGSPYEAVSEYNKFLKFDKIYGSEFGINEKGIYTGVVLHEPPQYKKELIVRHILNHNLSFRGSIGVGDTESDIGFLELVDTPIAFNPNLRLAKFAHKKKWKIVIERKDLIVELAGKKVKLVDL